MESYYILQLVEAGFTQKQAETLVEVMYAIKNEKSYIFSNINLEKSNQTQEGEST